MEIYMVAPIYQLAMWYRCELGYHAHGKHWGIVTHTCVGKLTIIGSDKCLAPGRRQAIIRSNAGILLIGPLGRNIGEILIGIQTFSFKNMHLKMSSANWRPFCLGLNVLNIDVCAYSRPWVKQNIWDILMFQWLCFNDKWTHLKPKCRNLSVVM